MSFGEKLMPYLVTALMFVFLIVPVMQVLGESAQFGQETAEIGSFCGQSVGSSDNIHSDLFASRNATVRRSVQFRHGGETSGKF